MKIEKCPERWKPILNGEYQVSDRGRVKVTETGKIMSCSDNYAGYKIISLYRGVNKQFRVHRLVAEAFVDNFGEGDEVNHIDGNKGNNNFDNLEWVTSKENKQHAILTGLFQQRPVIDENGTWYRSVRDAARKCGLDSSSIAKVCKGEYSHTKGRFFRYA